MLQPVRRFYMLSLLEKTIAALDSKNGLTVKLAS